MPQHNRVVKPGRTKRCVLTDTGEQLVVPLDWALLAPGDGPLTKMVKAKGPTWLVQLKVNKRLISRGIWAKEEYILAAQKELAAKRSAPGYARKRHRDLARREERQQNYVEDFYAAVLDFLGFHPRYATLAAKLAGAVTDLATPVGSGTVARTERIPLADRAGSAVIAWLRHQTTNYDWMTIARVKGTRRQVRRELACRSLNLLQLYRAGTDIPPSCPLQRVLSAVAQEDGD